MRIELETIYGILIPFLGTSLGAGCVFFMRKSFETTVQMMLNGFAAGVMVAASVWSLLIPAMEQASDLGNYAFAPAVVGLWAGMLSLLFLNKKLPRIFMKYTESEDTGNSKKKRQCLLWRLPYTIYRRAWL